MEEPYVRPLCALRCVTGSSCKGEKFRQGVCHEDPQQVGDAKKSRGTQLNLSSAKSIRLVWKITLFEIN